MRRYLLVTQPGDSTSGLVRRAAAIRAGEPDAELVLLVAVRRPGPDPFWTGAQDWEAARSHAGETSWALTAAGVALADVRVTGPVPAQAIASELKSSPGYAAVVLQAPSDGFSARMRLGLPDRLRRRFPGVTFVVDARTAT